MAHGTGIEIGVTSKTETKFPRTISIWFSNGINGTGTETCRTVPPRQMSIPDQKPPIFKIWLNKKFVGKLCQLKNLINFLDVGKKSGEDQTAETVYTAVCLGGIFQFFDSGVQRFRFVRLNSFWARFRTFMKFYGGQTTLIT